MKFKKNALAVLALAVVTAAQATPSPVGSIGFADIGSPAVSPGDDITTASIYNIGELLNLTDGTRDFAGLNVNLFGSVSFDINNPTSFSFSNPTFGSFNSTVIDLYSQGVNSITYDILGSYNSGTFDGGTIVDVPASFLITFSQVGGPGKNIADSATFSIPPVAPAPEPTTLAMSAVGGLMGLVAYRRRK